MKAFVRLFMVGVFVVVSSVAFAVSSLEDIRTKAEHGHADAQNRLGIMYSKGQDVAKDDTQAVEWFRKAAEQGYATAQNNLGILYGRGQGVAKDDMQAAQWYRKAAEQGHAAAQNNLGLMYSRGQGVAKDDRQAAAWYRKAAEQGYATAQYNLAVMYRDGRGVVKDDTAAAAWYRKAAEQGYATAQYNLGNMYSNGAGVAKDEKQAEAWYRKAAAQGNADAKVKLDSLVRQKTQGSDIGERALSFDVTAALQADASMIVTECIRVNIEHKIIRRGITHAYPIKEIYDGRKVRHYGFELLSVKLDGEPVPYHTTGSSGTHHGMAIGNADKLAPLGEHTYEIVYKTDGHVRFLPERDEIFYNVMSADWKFPVDRVSFTLQLPAGSEEAFLDALAYTGKRGERGSDYVVDGKNTVRSTRTLNPGEGLTVALAWKKGVIAPRESLANIIGSHRDPALIGIFIILLLFFGASRLWSLRGSKGVVIPLFSPPEGMSPGYAASLNSMKYEGRLLHADILWLAVNGFVRLDARDEKKILLSKAEAEGPKRLKSGGEWAREQCRELVARLFPDSSQKVDLRSQVGRAVAADSFDYLKGTYTAQQRGFWQRNYGAAVFGVILFLALYGWILPDIHSPIFDMHDPFEFMFIYSFMFGLLGLFVFGMFRAIRRLTGLRRVIGGLILSPLMCIGILAALRAISKDDLFLVLPFAATFGLVAWSIFTIRTRPTPKGRDRHLQVQGLEMYIRTAETHRLAMLNAPEDTVEKFEELLPYAVALGCANAWQKRFDTVLRAENYTPMWAETDDGRYSYSTVLTSVAAGSAGMAAAVNAAKAASDAARSARSDSDSSGDSGSDSGFSDDSSSGGGSGGSSVGGW